jgi:hypothetical protein
MDLILVAWIKFTHFSIEAPIAVAIIIVPVQLAILLFGRVMYKRAMRWKVKGGFHLLPDRRYSQIAEMWDEDEDEMEFDEESGLLGGTVSYKKLKKINVHKLYHVNTIRMQ